MTECPDCNFLFCGDDPENVAQHSKRHDIYLLGVRVTMQPDQESVIWWDMTSQMTVVTAYTPSGKSFVRKSYPDGLIIAK